MDFTCFFKTDFYHLHLYFIFEESVQSGIVLHHLPKLHFELGDKRIKNNNIYYYALNKILNSDWLNIQLTLVPVWLVGSNVRQRNLMSG